MNYQITLIAACAKNRTIGYENQLLWHLPKDFLWFKKHTLHKDVVMGRHTMLNIMSYTKGKPLPERTNIVLSRTIQEAEQPELTQLNKSVDSVDSVDTSDNGNGNKHSKHNNYNGFIFCSDFQDILEQSKTKEIMIIGGAQIYQLFIPYAQKIILTEIDKEYQGDAFFPEFNKEDYNISFSQKEIEKDLAYQFIIYEKFK